MKNPEEFRVPSLSEVDATYKDLERRRQILSEKKATLAREQDALEAEIGSRAPLPYSTSVAALLGEDADAETENRPRARFKELKAEIRDIEIAIEVIDRRLAEQKPKANAAVLAACRPEYGKRVLAVVDALQAVSTARAAYEQMRNEFEAGDIQWSALDPLGLGFLGDARDGHVQRIVREAREAGYVN